MDFDSDKLSALTQAKQILLYLKNKTLFYKSANYKVRKRGIIAVEILTFAQSLRKK